MRSTRGGASCPARNSQQLVSWEMRRLNGHAASEANLKRVESKVTVLRLIILSYPTWRA
jgi:hypothetical protein